MNNLRGKIVLASPTGKGGHVNEYICTAHYGDRIEIVPICPGTEGLAFPPIPLSGSGLVGVVHDCREDAGLIRRVKDRCASVIRGLEEGNRLFSFLFPPGALRNTLQGVQRNLARLDSLDGDQPAAVSPPVPRKDARSALDRAFDKLFGVVGEIQDSIFAVPKSKECSKAMIGAHPSRVGKLLFLEIPLECDDPIEQVSGEYIVVGQSPDSLYVVNTCSCLAATTVLRFPFSNEAGKKLLILDEYEDDEFIQEFIERLDDMDTDDYDAIDCDAAETVSRQLKRMLEKKLADRAKTLDDPCDRIIKAGEPLNLLGSTSGRVSGTTPNRSADRSTCRTECCGCGV